MTVATVDNPTLTTSRSDADDVALAASGDRMAFERVYRTHVNRVFAVCARMVADRALAEELTQDVFVQVFRFRHRYKPQSRLSTWMFTIATNLCLNELRRPEQKRRVDIWDTRRDTDEHREGPQLADPDAVTPEAGAASRELARRLETAVDELPAKQRAALLLSRVDGLAYRDVAEALACSEGAVKALLFRATQSLKKTLREYL